ncbi:MAG: sodium:calcium antiporter [Calditrichaeota bacterium]|nr:MAG: sodium:calcium antiporter [Calditrichota bacterium]
MAEQIIFFVWGLLLLYIGAELLVGASSRMALLLDIAPMVVGLTVVAFGTSAPEFIVSLIAALNGKIDVAVGNIVGSNIANIGLVLALSALLRPIKKVTDGIRDELIWVLVASLLFFAFAMDRQVITWEGALLTIGIFVFTGLLIRRSMQNRDADVADDVPGVATGWLWLDSRSRGTKLFLLAIGTVGGIVVLGKGSEITIDAAVAIAEYLGVSQIVIGLTMVAFGTSLPELATGIISVIKKENEILVGNVIGSNIFNILGVAGPIALMFNIPVAASNLTLDFPVMILFTLLLIFALFFLKRLGRLLSLLLFSGYLLYIYYTFTNIS